MRKQRAGFAEEQREMPFDDYIGEYEIFYVQSSGSFAGRVERIEGEYVVLNPYQTGIWDKEKGHIKKIIENQNCPMRVKLSSIVGIEPTTKESLEAYCEYQNLHQEENDKQKKKRTSLIHVGR